MNGGVSGALLGLHWSVKRVDVWIEAWTLNVCYSGLGPGQWLDCCWLRFITWGDWTGSSPQASHQLLTHLPSKPSSTSHRNVFHCIQHFFFLGCHHPASHYHNCPGGNHQQPKAWPSLSASPPWVPAEGGNRGIILQWLSSKQGY